MSEIAVLRQAFSGFPCGVVAIGAEVDGDEQVLIASSFTVGVSQDPPLVTFAVQHTSSTWPVLRQAERLGISVLGEDHADRTRQLASTDRANRLNDIDRFTSVTGAVLLKSAPIRFECSLWATYPAGDHEIVVLRVEELAVDFERRPLLWHRSALAVVE